jgi:2-isopropylmalate synthase
MTSEKNAAGKDRIIIFDTTLRDGEQSPGASMTLEEKLQVATLLDQMGVDVIEAGFPIASNGDFEAVAEIAKRVKRSTVCGLARAGNKDIDRAGEALKGAERPRIHTFISTSPLHMKHKLQMEPEDVYAAVISSVTRARKYTDDVEWSPEDGTRTEHDFLCRTVEAAIKAGATTINIPDTVGSSGCYWSGCRTRTRRCFRRTATTTSAWRWRTRSPACGPGRGRSNARSTGSASGRATPRLRRS